MSKHGLVSEKNNFANSCSSDILNITVTNRQKKRLRVANTHAQLNLVKNTSAIHTYTVGDEIENRCSTTWNDTGEKVNRKSVS